MYKLVKMGVRRLSDNADIPNNPNNPDWLKYEAWLAKSNTPEPMDKPALIEDPRIALIAGVSDISDVRNVLKELFGL